MRRQSILALVMVFFLYSGLPRADAIIYIDDGGTHDINYPINDEVWVDWQAPGIQTTLNLIEGGSINQPYDLQAYEKSQINIFGGSIGNAFYAYDSSQVNISGGSISWRLSAYDNSQVSFGGGFIGGYLEARDNSQVDIFGGWMQSLHVYINSQAILSGGYIKNLLVVYTTGTLTIQGSAFEVDGVPYGYGELSSILGGNPWNEPRRHLTGTLASGEFLDNDFFIGDSARIVLVHEPACPASFQGLGDLSGGNFYSQATDISADGSVVVGLSASSLGQQEAFRWTSSEGMQGLGDLSGGSFKSGAYAVSADGSVVVGRGNSDLGWKVVRWENGIITSLDFGGNAHGVSADGAVVVGYTRTPSVDSEAFRWTEAGGMQVLGMLDGFSNSSALAVSSDGLVVVGASDGVGLLEAFRWTLPGGMQGLGDLHGGGKCWSIARGVSADGSIVVGQGRSELGTEAFRWTLTGGMQGLGDLPGGDFYSNALAVSSNGSVVVGESRSGSYKDEAFIWDATNGMRNLKELLVNDYGLDLTGWTLAAATGISDDGLTIVGWGINPNGNTEAWIARLCEPAVIEVTIDIKPGSCPNPLNIKSRGVLPVAILGSEDFDVNSIDIASIRLAGVAPIRSSYEDVATPVSDANECECSTEGPDGFLDLTLKFETQMIVEVIGEVNNGDELTLELTGVLSDETPIDGSDCVIIRGKHKPLNKADFNGNGIVDMADFAAFSENWLQSSIVEY